MIFKVYNPEEKLFHDNGLGTVSPLKCIETKKASLNGWYVEVEVAIKNMNLIQQDNIILVETKEKGAQPFRIKNPDKKNNRISFTAYHVIFDAENYFLEDVRPTELPSLSYLLWCNERTDKESPFTILGTNTGEGTNYFIRKNLLEAFQEAESCFGIMYDADKFNVNVRMPEEVGRDNGFSLVYGKNVQGIRIIENWDSVCTRIYPVGSNELMLPEKYIDAEIQYKTPYTRTVTFDTPEEDEEGNEYTLEEKQEFLRTYAKEYLEENQYPKLSYEVNSDVPQELQINDVIHVKHPMCDIKINVQEYTYDCITKRVKTITYGNYDADVKSLFKNAVSSSQENVLAAADGKISAYDEGIQRLAGLIEGGLGIFITKKTAENGSTKYYLHDKPELDESTTVWTMVDNALAVSTDGGKTWNAGISSDGKAVVNVLNAVGINADWINAGQVKTENIDLSYRQGVERRFNSAESRITATENGLSLKVSKGGVVSEINQSSDKIVLSSDRLVVDSTNFKLTESGCVTINAGVNDVNKEKPNLTVINNEKYTRVGGGGIAFFDSSRYGEVSPMLLRSKYVCIGDGPSSVEYFGIVTTEEKERLYVDGTAVITNEVHAKTLYSSSGTVSSSDAELKKDVESLDAGRASNFIYSLNPVEYRFIDNNSNRLHHGLIAQEVKDRMGDDDWGLYVDESINNTKGGNKGLRYDELIADLIATVQSQNERLKSLETSMKLDEKE